MRWSVICLFLTPIFLLGCDSRFATYEEKGYGIKIKYPKDWARKENQVGTVVVFISPKENAIDPFQENFNIVVQDVATGMDLKQYTATAILQMKTVFNNVILSDPAPVRVAGRDGMKLEYIVKAEFDLKVIHEWMLKDNHAYQLTFIADKDHFEQYWPTVQTMLNSFQVR